MKQHNVEDSNRMRIDAVYFCTTPYQIMTSVHLSKVMKQKADIYLVDQMNKVNEIAERLSQTSIFNKVRIIREKEVLGTSKSRIKIHLKLAHIYSSLDKYVEHFLDTEIEYRELYISSKAFIGRIVSMYYIKHGYNTKIVYYDDGLGSYYDKTLLNPKKSDLILRYFSIGRDACRIKVSKIMLYEPELFIEASVNNRAGIKIEAIPKWDTGSEFIQKMNMVFDYKDSDSINNKVIIFDGLFNQNDRKKINQLYLDLSDKFGKDNIIIKPHPRDKSKRPGNLNYYNKFEIPFEIICANCNLENRILVTFLSTAVVTPLMLMGQEPYVLTLNEIDDLLQVPFCMNYGDFKELYTDKNRFLVAHSIHEAISFIESHIY